MLSYWYSEMVCCKASLPNACVCSVPTRRELPRPGASWYGRLLGAPGEGELWWGGGSEVFSVLMFWVSPFPSYSLSVPLYMTLPPWPTQTTSLNGMPESPSPRLESIPGTPALFHLSHLPAFQGTAQTPPPWSPCGTSSRCLCSPGSAPHS